MQHTLPTSHLGQARDVLHKEAVGVAEATDRAPPAAGPDHRRGHRARRPRPQRAGKTTAVCILATLLRADSGTARVG